MHESGFATFGEKYFIKRLMNDLQNPKALSKEIKEDEKYIKRMIVRDDNYFSVALMGDDLMRKEEALRKSTIWYTLRSSIYVTELNQIIMLYVGSYNDQIEETIRESTERIWELHEKIIKIAENIQKLCEYETILNRQPELTKFAAKFGEIIQMLDLQEVVLKTAIFGGKTEKESLGIKWDGEFPRKSLCNLL